MYQLGWEKNSGLELFYLDWLDDTGFEIDRLFVDTFDITLGNTLDNTFTLTFESNST